MSQVLKTEAEVREGLAKVAEGSEEQAALTDRLTAAMMSKEQIVKTLSVLEDEILQKEKAVKKRK